MKRSADRRGVASLGLMAFIGAFALVAELLVGIPNIDTANNSSLNQIATAVTGVDNQTQRRDSSKDLGFQCDDGYLYVVTETNTGTLKLAKRITLRPSASGGVRSGYILFAISGVLPDTKSSPDKAVTWVSCDEYRKRELLPNHRPIESGANQLPVRLANLPSFYDSFPTMPVPIEEEPIDPGSDARMSPPAQNAEFPYLGTTPEPYSYDKGQQDEFIRCLMDPECAAELSLHPTKIPHAIPCTGELCPPGQAGASTQTGQSQFQKLGMTIEQVLGKQFDNAQGRFALVPFGEQRGDASVGAPSTFSENKASAPKSSTEVEMKNGFAGIFRCSPGFMYLPQWLQTLQNLCYRYFGGGKE
jgi:hypothetical protein